jgi:hypothetical protein
MTETTELSDSVRRPSVVTQNNDKLQPTHLVAKAQQHYHKHGPGKVDFCSSSVVKNEF